MSGGPEVGLVASGVAGELLVRDDHGVREGAAIPPVPDGGDADLEAVHGPEAQEALAGRAPLGPVGGVVEPHEPHRAAVAHDVLALAAGGGDERAVVADGVHAAHVHPRAAGVGEVALPVRDLDPRRADPRGLAVPGRGRDSAGRQGCRQARTHGCGRHGSNW